MTAHDRQMRRDTAILEAGYQPAGQSGPFISGPQFSGTYTAPGDPAQNPLTYGRFHNPTWTALEAALGVLDGGEAVSFASGMAAVVALFGVVLKPGDTIVIPDDGYYTVRVLAANWLTQIGVHHRLVTMRESVSEEAMDGARLVWLETPSNPRLEVCDIAAVVKAAHAREAVVAVDNTTATGYLQQPLSIGADFIVASDSKALTGHSDLILGHVSAGSTEWTTALRTWRTQHGAIPGPMEAWLAHRSIATLAMRMTRQCESAQRLADFLVSRLSERAVLYPGLRHHPGHAIATRQMSAFGSVVSFDLQTRARADAFFRALTLVREATSFGGVHSTAERRARWGADAISEGFIRFSVGCEDGDDIIADVEQALANADNAKVRGPRAS
jgi:cystathionine gamma-lyase